MRIVHYSRFRKSDGTIAPKHASARRALGVDWLVSLHAEDSAIQILADNLDDDYILLCNITLPQLKHDTDLILLGPKGIWVFELIYFEGLFKADGHDLAIFNTREQRFKRCRPNSLHQAAEDAQVLRNLIEPYFTQNGARVPWVIPVVMSVNPKTLIQRTETVTNTILRFDELYDYASRTIKRFENTLSIDDVDAVADSLNQTARSLAAAPEQKKMYYYRQKRIRGYSMQQWTILLAIIAVNVVCFSSIAIAFIYVNSPVMRATMDGWLVRLRILLFR
jgi:hypothetical protein